MATDLQTGTLIGQEFQQRLAELFARGLPIEILIAEIERLYLEGFQPVLESEFHRSILELWLRGADDVLDLPGVRSTKSSSMFPPLIPPNLLGLLFPDDEPIVRLPAIENAARRLLERRVVSRDDFRRLSAAARQEAFTISGDLTESAIEQVRDVLAEDIREGASLRGFSNRLAERMEAEPIGISPAHLEQVFRNADNESYSQGHEDILDHPLVADGFPYRAYWPIRDFRTRTVSNNPRREGHRELEFMGLNGTNIYYRKDPTWIRFRPPWSWGCRCGWGAISIEDAAAAGVQEAIEWLATGIEPNHPPVPVPPFSPPAEWERMELIAA